MARHVDRAQREQDIAKAAIRILSEEGPAALTLRRLAKELGGSQTLITHFYPNREELFRAVTDRLIASYDEDLGRLEQGKNPAERLRLLLEWMLPMGQENQLAERGRVLLVGQRNQTDGVQHFFDAHESKMRQLLRDHVTPLSPADRVEPIVEILRVLVNGVALSTVEHPGEWPDQRLTGLLDSILDTLGLLGASSSAAS